MSASTPLIVVPVWAAAGGGTERLLRPLHGTSSLERTLQSAVDDLPEADIVVTTDDADVKALVRTFGHGVIAHDREIEDYVAAVSAVSEEYEADIVAILEPTHPFRPKGLVKRTVENLAERDHLDSVVCVRRFKANLWRMESDNSIEALGSGGESRDPTYFQELVGLALATRPNLLRHGRRLGDAVGFELVDQFWGMVDIRDDTSLAVADAVADHLTILKDTIR